MKKYAASREGLRQSVQEDGIRVGLDSDCACVLCGEVVFSQKLAKPFLMCSGRCLADSCLLILYRLLGGSLLVRRLLLALLLRQELSPGFLQPAFESRADNMAELAEFRGLDDLEIMEVDE